MNRQWILLHVCYFFCKSKWMWWMRWMSRIESIIEAMLLWITILRQWKHCASLSFFLCLRSFVFQFSSHLLHSHARHPCIITSHGIALHVSWIAWWVGFVKDLQALGASLTSVLTTAEKRQLLDTIRSVLPGTMHTLFCLASHTQNMPCLYSLI